MLSVSWLITQGSHAECESNTPVVLVRRFCKFTGPGKGNHWHVGFKKYYNRNKIIFSTEDVSFLPSFTFLLLVFCLSVPFITKF